MSDSADFVDLVPDAPLGAENADTYMALFSEAAYHDDAALTEALDAAGFDPLVLSLLPDGTYENQGAAFDAWITYEGGETDIVIAFRGTDDFDTSGDLVQSYLESSDAAGWTDTYAYLDLMAEGLEAVDAYAAEEDVDVVYVTGHSLGGAAAQAYMSLHQDTEDISYSAVTFGSPGVFDDDGRAPSAPEAALSPDMRITQFADTDDFAPLFGVQLGGVQISVDTDPSTETEAFDIAALLEDPSEELAAHSMDGYAAAAAEWDALALGVADASAEYTLQLGGVFGVSGVIA